MTQPKRSTVCAALLSDSNSIARSRAQQYSSARIVITPHAGIQFFANNLELPSFEASFLDPGVRRDDKIANFNTCLVLRYK